MNTITKKKWINALKSGKYEQGMSCLREGNSYCCLGVLCAITGNAKNRNMRWGFPIPGIIGETLDDTSGDPRPFMGLSVKMQLRLAEMNDHGSSFEEIAKYISKNVRVTPSKK